MLQTEYRNDKKKFLPFRISTFPRNWDILETSLPGFRVMESSTVVFNTTFNKKYDVIFGNHH